MTTHIRANSVSTIDRLHRVSVSLFSRVFGSSASAILVTICSLALSLAAPRASLADVFTNVPEASGYTLLYDLLIPNVGNFRDANLIPYSTDNSRTVGSFNRVAYYVELDTGGGPEYAYASMDAFTSNVRRVGMPHNTQNPYVTQQIVSNLNVFHSGVGSGISTASGSNGLATGNIEMWPSNYGGGNAIGIPGASGTTLDFGDGNNSTARGYGSFQVHNYGASETLLAYNRWGQTGNSDLGTGNDPNLVRPSYQPDWTFAQNAATYATTKRLQVLVRETAPAAAVSIPSAPAKIVANAAEAATYSVIYELPILNAPDYDAVAPVYNTDNSSSFRDGSFDRLGYYLELENAGGDTQYAWVSMDNFTNNASLAGVPTFAKGAIFQDLITSVNVVSDVAPDATAAAGNIEFWPDNYSNSNVSGSNSNGSTVWSGRSIPGASNSLYDEGDARTTTGGAHGSMQIHVNGSTVIAFNNWNSAANPALGIGNRPTSHPDWTFATTGSSWTVKNLWVLAEVSGASLTETPGTGAAFDFGHLHTNESVLLDDAVTLVNTGADNSLISVSGFSLTGPGASLFDVVGFSPTTLEAGFLDDVSFDLLFQGSGEGLYAAALTFFTSEGDVTYQLSASVVPEPATFALMGFSLLGFVIVACRGRARKRT